MDTLIAPNKPNVVRLGGSLQVRVDVHHEASITGTLRLRGYHRADCSGSTCFCEKQSLAEAHAHVKDREHEQEFVVLVFDGIPFTAHLRLDLDAPGATGGDILLGPTLEDLKKAPA